MKRPSKKDKYILKPHLIEEYVEELEKYCDELEERKKRLDKALDKACEIIVHLYGNICYWTPKEWKEWLMKDE